MKIDWKKVAASAGYKLMKGAVANDANKIYSNGKRFAAAFNFAINRAKQHIYVKAWPDDKDYTDDLTLILQVWELNRNQSFLSYYSNNNLPKKTTKILKPMRIRGKYKYYKGRHWCKNTNRAAQEVSMYLINNRTKKARWNNERKANAKY